VTWPIQNYNGISVGDRVTWNYSDRQVVVTVEEIYLSRHGARFTIVLDNGGRLIGAMPTEIRRTK
jgi:hypothetical protein